MEVAMMMMMIMWSYFEQKFWWERLWLWLRWVKRSLSNVGVLLMLERSPSDGGWSQECSSSCCYCLLVPAVSRKICIGSWWGGVLKMMTEWQPLQWSFDLCHFSWPWQIARVLGVILTFKLKVIRTSKGQLSIETIIVTWSNHQDSGHLHIDRLLLLIANVICLLAFSCLSYEGLREACALQNGWISGKFPKGGWGVISN